MRYLYAGNTDTEGMGSQLLIDLDGQDARARFDHALKFLPDTVGVKAGDYLAKLPGPDSPERRGLKVLVFPSPGGKPWRNHAFIFLSRKIPMIERIARQANAGSDVRREECSLNRALHGVPFPSYLVTPDPYPGIVVDYTCDCPWLTPDRTTGELVRLRACRCMWTSLEKMGFGHTRAVTFGRIPR